MALFSISHLHVLGLRRSASWAIGSGSLATLVLLRVNGCPSLYAMEYGLVRASDAIKDQPEGNYSYLKYEHNSKINIMFIYNYSVRYIMYYRSTYLFCRGLVQSSSLFFTLRDWITREGQKNHCLGGRTTWQLDFSADQLVEPLGS
jgi:hypothetical protein